MSAAVTTVELLSAEILGTSAAAEAPGIVVGETVAANLIFSLAAIKLLNNRGNNAETGVGQECKIHPKDKQAQQAMHQSEKSKPSRNDFQSKNKYRIVSSANETKNQANLPPRKPQNTNTANDLKELVSVMEIKMPSDFSFNVIFSKFFLMNFCFQAAAHVNNAREGLLHILVGHGCEFDINKLKDGIPFNSNLSTYSSDLQNLVNQLNQQKFTDVARLNIFQIQFNQKDDLRDSKRFEFPMQDTNPVFSYDRPSVSTRQATRKTHGRRQL